MDIVSYFKLLFGSDFEEPVFNHPDPKEFIEILDKKLPLYGEPLGIEVDFLEKSNEYIQAASLKLSVLLVTVNALVGSPDISDEEARTRLIDCISNKGIYFKTEESVVTPFDPEFVENYDLVKGLYNPLISYTEDGIFVTEDGNNDFSLKSLIFNSYSAWEAIGVQGDSFMGMVRNIISERDFVIKGSNSYVDISQELSEFLDEETYKILAVLKFVKSPKFISDLLLYTRVGINNPNLYNTMLRGDIENLINRCMAEFNRPDPVVVNTDNPEPEDEVINTDSTETVK
jgi:hypothetical protein